MKVEPESHDLRRILGEQAFTRAAGAPLIEGNQCELLVDARENYPAWRRAIEASERFIHFEMYILRDDRVGREFAELLIGQAQRGVQVRLLYDWLGSQGKTGARFWRHLRTNGVEVLASNPPRLTTPFGWLSRDHRKTLIVDNEVAFVSGLCVGNDWLGDTDRGIAPWRDTGISLRGPAVAEIDRAFESMWQLAGGKILNAESTDAASPPGRGDCAVRVIAGTPETGALFRTDLLWASIASHRLYLTDAYFIGTTSYLDALRSAAGAGVDVRLLVPSASDIRAIAAFSRTQYRSLLNSGVRVFEWNGPMVHAKTAVVDGRWARVGSSNLNIASWIGNWELDVCIENERFAAKLAETFLRDLDNSTEIVVGTSKRPRQATTHPPAQHQRRIRPGSAGRAAAAAIELGGSIGSAMTRRSLAPTEARSYAVFAIALFSFTAIAILLPRLLTVPLAILAAVGGVSFTARAIRLRRANRTTDTQYPRQEQSSAPSVTARSKPPGDPRKKP